MSTSQDDDETQVESQVDDTQDEDRREIEDEEMDPAESDPKSATATDSVQPKKPVELVREPGKSVLPFARVQKIIKADKEIPIVAKEATFLISLATEEFIRRLTEAGQQAAHREKRSTVQHRDIATVVRKADEFLFLEEVISWTSADAPAKRSVKAKATGGKPTLLDQFVVSKRDAEEDTGDIIMNEDGTMYAGNADEHEQ